MPYGLQKKKKKNHLAWALTMDPTIYSNLGHGVCLVGGKEI